MADFIERLKQRKIVQWALAYVAASFALIQVIDIVAQRFGWPAQTIRVVILALAVGFCIVLVLAWYHGERGAQRVTGMELLILAIFLAVGGRMIWNLAGESDSAPSRASADTKSIDLKSIAVLPFESLSDDKENAYFADGIQDEILTRLAKIGELRVISRTSTQQYSAKTRNLRDIGRELGVGMVLEGSVRRVDQVVRVTVQLISAASDEHVWAESYDRRLDDVLGVESDIAQAVASALHVKLSGSQAAVVAARPTTNADAYDLYLRALAVETHAAGLTYDRHHVASLYEDAVRQDPTFALAWAHLAIARSNMFFSFYDRSSDDAAAVKAAAKAAVDKALALDPTLGEAYLALGFYRYRCLHDFAGGLTAFEQARQRLPNNAEVLASISFIERRQGRWRDSLEHLQAATQRDPRDLSLFSELSTTYSALRDFTNARAALDRALEIEPDSISLLGLKAQTYQNEGNLPEAARLLQRIPVRSEDFYNFTIHVDQLLYERRLDEVVRIIDSALSKPSDDLVSIHAYCRIVLGSVQAWLGKNVESRSNFQVALKAGLRVRKSQADDVQLAQFFAVVYAGLGDEQNAIAMAKRNIELNADDSLALPQAQILLAWVQSVFSDKAAAVAAMPHLLEVPAGLTIAELRMHPKWDALRADLNFQKLVASPSAD